MKIAIRTFAALLALSSTAVADDWAGTPTTAGSGGSVRVAPYVRCVDYNNVVTLPPCVADGRLHNLSGSSQTVLTKTLSGFVSDPSSSASVQIQGTFADPSSASGYSTLNTFIPLSEFARSSTVTTLGTQVSSVSTSLSQLTQDLAAFQITTSSANAELSGQVLGVEARVTAIEASVGSLASISNLNALAIRVASAESQLAAIQSGVADLAAYVPEALGDIRRQADEGSAMAAAMTTVAPADGKANRIGFNTATYNGTTALALSYSRATGDVDFNVGVAMAGDNAMVKAGAGFSW